MNITSDPVNLILSKLAEDTGKTHERAQKACEMLLGELDTRIAQTPYEVVFQEDRVKLKYYQPENRPADCIKTPLLVVYALINRETILDLQPDRSITRSLLDNGIDLYTIDWGYPTEKDKYLTLDDHINGYIDSVVDFILERHRCPRINIMGICMGGTMSLIYAALHQKKIKNLIATVTPSNFDTDQGLLHIWAKYLNPENLINACGNMPGELMNIGFLMLNPARLMIDKYFGFMENNDNKDFVENFIRMEKWIFDSPDVPGETFKQFVTDFYQKNLLFQNQLVIGGKHVDLKKVTIPVLNIYGRFDHLVPPGACDLLTSRVGSKDTENVCLETGHIGIYVSSKTQKEFVPKIVEWLKQRDGENKTKKRKGQREP